MADRATETTSPQRYARVGLVPYLIHHCRRDERRAAHQGLAGGVGQRRGHGRQHPRGALSLARRHRGDLLLHICDVGLMLVFYVLLRPVNRNLAWLVVLFNLVQTSVLVARSSHLPAALGVMMQIAGVCYVVNSFALVLYPPLGTRLFPFILLPPFVAELSLALWLLLKGVDVARWRASA